MEKATYVKIGEVAVSPNRKIVLSACSKGGYTMAQQVEIEEEDGKKIPVFLKGAIHIADTATLSSFAEMLEAAAVSESEWENGEENSKNA